MTGVSLSDEVIIRKKNDSGTNENNTGTNENITGLKENNTGTFSERSTSQVDTSNGWIKQRLQELKRNPRFRVVLLVLAVYGFLLSINMMGAGFEWLGEGFAESLEDAFSDPFAAFCIGLLVTGIIQSSSGTTSLLVALVASGDLEMELAIPAVMGANIGTAVTNIIVSFGHVSRKNEFRLAFGGSLVHDFFNVIAVIILLPIELIWHPLQNMAKGMKGAFGNMGGLKVASPIKLATTPIIHVMKDTVEPLEQNALILIITGIVLLFLCMKLIVSSMRLFMMSFAQKMVDKYLFKGPAYSFALGLSLTAAVQSSSITTSLLVPLQGAGILKIEKILPFTIGANIGTTVTAILAALATANGAAICLAFAHLCFNILGGAIIYFLPFPILSKERGQEMRAEPTKSFPGRIPFLSRIRFEPILRNIPVILAKKSGDFVVDNKYGLLLIGVGYVGGMIYIMPLLYLILTGAIKIPI